MAGKVKGITIEFRGDTTSVDKAIRKVNSESKDLTKQLSAVDKALKFNPKNTELLAQKQTLLKERIKQTEDGLKEFKQIQDDLDAKGVEKTSAEYMAVRRNIVEAESKLKHFNSELQKTSAQASRLNQVGQAMQNIGGKISTAGQALMPFSAAAATALTALGGLAVKSAGMADDLITLSKQTGISTDDLQKYAAAADLVDVSVDSIAKSQQRLKRNMLTAAEGGASAEYFERLGVSVTDANGELRDSNEVFMELIKALGSMENETERDALAMQIFGKSATDLNPLIEDMGATYEKTMQMLEENGLSPISEEDLKRANEFQDALDTIKLVVQQAMAIIGSKLASVLMPVVEKIVEKVTAFASWASQASPELLAKIAGILAAVAAIGPVLLTVGKLITGVGTAISAVSKVWTALSTALMANPIGIVIALIAALVAAFIYAWNNIEGFREFFINAWETIKAAFGAAVDWIKAKWDAIVAFFSGIPEWFRNLFTTAWENIKAAFANWVSFWSGLWDAVKNKFSELGTSIASAISGAVKSGINGVISMIENTINGAIRLINGAIGLINKIPGVSVGTLSNVSLPRLAKGGVLYGAQTVIAGEAGPEAIIPLDRLFAQMDRMADRIVNGEGGGVTVNVYASPGMDINALAREIETRIIDAQKRRRLAWQ